MDLNLLLNDLLLPAHLSETGKILVITGGRGVGKTTFCQKVIEATRASGLKVAGLLSPGRYENQKRNGIFAVDLAGGEFRLAASPVAGEIDGIRFGAWSFDSTVFEWGNQRLLESGGTDVLVIDELGFLEFDLSTGWRSSFAVLKTKNFRLALIVIRPECIESFTDLGFSFQVKQVLSPPPP